MRVCSARKRGINNRDRGSIAKEVFTCGGAPLPETTRAPQTWTGSQMQTHTSMTLHAAGIAGKQPFSLGLAENKEQGIPGMWDSTLTPPTCAAEGGNMLVCVSKCAWIPINCGCSPPHPPPSLLFPTFPSTARLQGGGIIPHCLRRPEALGARGYCSVFQLFPHSSRRMMFPELGSGNHNPPSTRIAAGSAAREAAKLSL